MIVGEVVVGVEVAVDIILQCLLHALYSHTRTHLSIPLHLSQLSIPHIFKPPPPLFDKY